MIKVIFIFILICLMVAIPTAFATDSDVAPVLAKKHSGKVIEINFDNKLDPQISKKGFTLESSTNSNLEIKNISLTDFKIKVKLNKSFTNQRVEIIYDPTVGNLFDLDGKEIQGFKIIKKSGQTKQKSVYKIIFPYPVPVVDPVQKKGGGGCSDCTPPTIGMDNKGTRLVDNGLVLNGRPLDVDYFKTHMPMQYTEIGKENHLQVKIYENQGVSNIQMVQFSMGLKEIGTPISEAQALLEIEVANFANDVDNPSILETNLIDKDEIVRDYRVYPSLVQCMDGFTQECLQLDLYWTYDKITNNPVLALNGWDTKRNSFTDYFNDGLTVIDPNPVTIEEPLDKPTKECKISKVPNRNNPCQFSPLIEYEKNRALLIFDSSTLTLKETVKN